ncbi:MAG: M23 family metallopeptidase [Bacilli bacterium]|nr:M23 family metallopeptidase [Bacilli bacterium]
MRMESLEKRIPLLIFVTIITSLLLVASILSKKMNDAPVTESPTIVENYEDIIPVINENNYLTNPYIDPSVTIGKTFYDYKGEEAAQENALVVQNNTYYQNTGVDYVKEDSFEVVSIAEGTILDVKEDELVGKVVEIEHRNGLISIYQSLSETTVQKGDSVIQGQVIGKSGTNEMDKELGNHLHFEIYENGHNVDPTLYLNKDYKKEN